MTRAPRVEQVATDAFAVTGTDVNWLVVREGNDVTLVDSGYPGDADGLVDVLATLGHRPQDVRAVLVTHAHADHIGGAAVLARAHDLTVLAHPREVPHVRREYLEQLTPFDVVRRSWRPRVAAWGLRIFAAGGTRDVSIPGVRAHAGSGQLDLPGRPVAVPCPGHTSGHTAYLFTGTGVLATGDILVTRHPLTTHVGPHELPAFTCHDTSASRDSLSALVGLDAEVLVPGHGPAWRGTAAQAVARAEAASAGPVGDSPPRT